MKIYDSCFVEMLPAWPPREVNVGQSTVPHTRWDLEKRARNHSGWLGPYPRLGMTLVMGPLSTDTQWLPKAQREKSVFIKSNVF